MKQDEHEPTTTPGDMQWVPCDHAYTTKDRAGVCEACRGRGRLLITVPRPAPGEEDARVLP